MLPRLPEENLRMRIGQFQTACVFVIQPESVLVFSFPAKRGYKIRRKLRAKNIY